MRLAKRILALLLMALAVFIVCVDLPLPDLSARGTGEEPPPAAISRLYRESDVIAIGVACTARIRTRLWSPAAS